MIKVNIISNTDISGGAARAAFRLNNALNNISVNSEMIVKNKLSKNNKVISPRHYHQRIIGTIIGSLSNKLVKIQKTKNLVHHSLNLVGSDVFKMINISNADIINIHWVGGETLSIKQISQINKPIIMTLHDMWAFCGCEHYCSDDEYSRFRVGYDDDNKEDISSSFDLNKVVWLKKKKQWKSPFTIVTPSRWLSKCAKESQLFRDWDVYTIPNALDTEMFKPVDKIIAREMFNLKLDKKLIGFGAMGGGSDPRKGFSHLIKALDLISNKADYECVIFGQDTPDNPPDFGLNVTYVGELHDDVTLSLFYNAIDVMVVPSLQENLPQTATEAQSCGTPVVAFNVTGFPDAIDHMDSGYLASAFSVDDLSFGITWCIKNANELSKKARAKALNSWSRDIVAKKYLDLYLKVVKQKLI